MKKKRTLRHAPELFHTLFRSAGPAVLQTFPVPAVTAAQVPRIPDVRHAFLDKSLAVHLVITTTEVFIPGQGKVHCADLHVVLTPAEIGNSSFTEAGNPLAPVTAAVPF